MHSSRTASDTTRLRTSAGAVEATTGRMGDDEDVVMMMLPSTEQQQQRGITMGTMRTRRRAKAAAGCFLATFLSLASSAVLVTLPGATRACVHSVDLREKAASSLLFWSGYDFSVDAVAAQFVGPLASSSSVHPQQLSVVPRGGAFAAAADADVDNNVDGGLFGGAEDGISATLDKSVSVARYEIDPPDMSSGSADGADDDNSNNGNVSSLCPTGPALSARGGGGGGGDEGFLVDRNSAVVSDRSNLVFSFFQDGDGSESDPDGIPTRYLLMQGGDRTKAARAVHDTLEWRKEHGIDNLLKVPQPKFDVCKSVFPHYFVGRDTDDHVVFVQRPALIDLEKGYRNELTKEELLMHYVYVNEYLWQVMEGDKPLGTMTSILDLSGLDFSILKKTDLIGFCKKFVQTMDSHYPQRAHKTLILNVPKWFNALYKIFSQLLRASTKEKIEVYARGRKQDEALVRVLGEGVANQLPPRFWSKKKLAKDAKKGKNSASASSSTSSSSSNDDDDDSSDEKENDGDNNSESSKPQVKDDWVPPESELETALRDFAAERLKEAGVEMQPVI